MDRRRGTNPYSVRSKKLYCRTNPQKTRVIYLRDDPVQLMRNRRMKRKSPQPQRITLREIKTTLDELSEAMGELSEMMGFVVTHMVTKEELDEKLNTGLSSLR